MTTDQNRARDVVSAPCTFRTNSVSLSADYTPADEQIKTSIALKAIHTVLKTVPLQMAISGKSRPCLFPGPVKIYAQIYLQAPAE